MNSNQQNYIIGIVAFAIINILMLIFAGRIEGDKMDRSIIISILGFSVHIHHWIIGVLGLTAAMVSEHYTGKSFIISGIKGISFGLMFHGIVYYSDYMHIISYDIVLPTK